MPSGPFFAGQTDYVEKLNALAALILALDAATLWLAGSGAPDDTVGDDSNFYLDTVAPGAIYGPKDSGHWPAGLSLGGGGGGGGGAGLHIGTTAPVDPDANPFWWKSDEGTLKIRYEDADSDEWVDAVAGLQGPPGDDGDDGDDGVDGKTILHGSGAPGGGTGADGDFYIDTATLTIYGPKASGAWGAGVVLPGTDGDDGVDGLGVPAGGAIGEALVKVSATDNDTTWARRLKPSETIQALDRVVPLVSDFGTAFGTGATFTDKSDRLQCVVTSVSSAVRGRVRSIPSAPYTLDVILTVMGNPADADACFGGLALSDGTKYRTWYAGHIGTTTDTATPRVYADTWNTTTSHGTAAKTQAFVGTALELHLRITDTGTLRTFLYSMSGKDFVQMFQEASNTFVTPTQWGLIAYNASTDSVPATMIFHHWKESAGILGDAA